MKKPLPTSSTEESSLPMDDREHEPTNPGESTESALDLGHDVEKALILDVLQHMRKQNEQQKENNKSQRETNARSARISKMLLVLCASGVVIIAQGVAAQMQAKKALSELEQLSRDYKLHKSAFAALKEDFEKKLQTTPADLGKQITQLEQKVDDAPKLTADRKTGELKLEVSVTKPSPKPSASAPAPKEPPLETQGGDPPKVVIPLTPQKGFGKDKR